MKTILYLILTLSTANLLASDDCGPITSVSTSGDHKSDRVNEANIKIKTWVRITETNSPQLTQDLTELVITDSGENSKGLFVCLDKYETYYENRQKFAKVSQYRIWQHGNLVKSNPPLTEETLAKTKVLKACQSLAKQAGKSELGYDQTSLRATVTLYSNQSKFSLSKNQARLKVLVNDSESIYEYAITATYLENPYSCSLSEIDSI